MSTLTISHKSLYIRLFLWVWQVNPDKLDICKLFWGTLFLPIGYYVSMLTTEKPGITFKRLGYLFMPIVILDLLEGAPAPAFRALLVTLVLISFGVFLEKRRRTKESYNGTSEKFLGKSVGVISTKVILVANSKPAKIAGKSTRIAIIVITAPLWVPVFVILFVVNRVLSALEYSSLGWAVGDAKDVIWEYVSSVKQRHCAPVKIE